jgi:hypothetical protein
MSKLGRYSAQRRKVETLTAAKTVEVAECGTEFLLNSATEFAVALPNASDAGQGWWCRFTVKAAPDGASYTVVATDADGDNIHGVVLSAEDAAGSGDSTGGTGTDVITFVNGKAKQGDWCEIWTDGTDWYAVSAVTEQDGITYS